MCLNLELVEKALSSLFDEIRAKPNKKLSLLLAPHKPSFKGDPSAVPEGACAAGGVRPTEGGNDCGKIHDVLPPARAGRNAARAGK